MPDPLLREETGRRVVVRYLLPSGSATDVLGDLQHNDAERLVVLPDLAAPVVIPATAVIAAKPVPARVVTPRSRLDLLARTMHRSWPGLVRRRLGGWILAASHGFSRRANSALAVGEPDPGLGEALDVTEGFFAAQELPPILQIPTSMEGPGPRQVELLDVLRARGYAPDEPTLVMIRHLRGGPPEGGRTIAADLSWSPVPDRDWLRLYELPDGVGGELAERVLTASTDHRFLTARVDGRPAGVARLAVIDRWAGITGLRVAAERRGQGLGGELLTQTLAAAGSAGASWAYLQVEGGSPAIALYERAGFVVHHRYQYWRRP